MANRARYYPWDGGAGTRTNSAETARLIQTAVDHAAAADLEMMRAKAAIWTARDLGATWQSIADGLGITRQAAQQRYGK